MKILEKYTGTKTFMFPNGAIATPEEILNQFPAILEFAHIIETDEAGEVLFAVQNLSAMKSLHGISKSLSESESITALQTIINTEPEQEPSAEERIASAMEFQNIMSL